MVAFLLTLALALPLGAKLIPVNAQQAQDLGITTQIPTPVSTMSLPSFNGRVIALDKDHISITARQDGVIVAVHVMPYESVKKGTTLVTVHSQDLLELEEHYIGACIAHENLSSTYQREEKLLQAGVIAQKRLQQTRHDMDQSTLKRDAFYASLEALGVREDALKKLQKTRTPQGLLTINAPLEGEILRANAHVGQYVASHHVLFELYAQGTRYIEFDVPLELLEFIHVGDMCSFKNTHGTITTMGQTVNPQSQSITVRARIHNPELVRIHSLHEVTLHAKAPQGVFRIPTSALVFSHAKAYVFRQVPSGFEALPVTLASEEAAHYTIKANLAPQDTLTVTATVALLSALEDDGDSDHE